MGNVPLSPAGSSPISGEQDHPGESAGSSPILGEQDHPGESADSSPMLEEQDYTGESAGSSPMLEEQDYTDGKSWDIHKVRPPDKIRKLKLKNKAKYSSPDIGEVPRRGDGVRG